MWTQNPSAAGFTGGFKGMWGDLVGCSKLTDEDFERLASDLEPWLISFGKSAQLGWKLK